MSRVALTISQVREGKASRYCRAAALAAGFPNTTSASSTSRFCSSGLKATQDIASQIATGSIDIGIAVGAESASFSPSRLDRDFVDDIMRSDSEARDILRPMGQTSENVARDFNITREEQDRYSVESYRRAEAAQREGWFDDEIVPLTVDLDGKKDSATVSKDEGPRWDTKYEALAKLKPSFPEHGDRSTAGNSSQVTDGAAAVLLMRRSKALELGQRVLAKYVGANIAGLAPRIMGIGPVLVSHFRRDQIWEAVHAVDKAQAIPKLLQKYRISLSEVDVIEINEAFASMAVYCRDQLNIDWSKLNPRGKSAIAFEQSGHRSKLTSATILGGAIALGHPFGCTGVRQIVTGLSECRRRKSKILLTSMCMGTGMGKAALFVNEIV